MKLYAFFLLLLLSVTPAVISQTHDLLDATPLQGSNDYYRLLSPSFLGRVVSPAWVEAPIAAVINPALNAKTQRVYLNFGYIGMLVADNPSGVEGHTGVFAASIPFRWGVISSSLHVINAELPSYTLHTSGAAHLSFSKAITDQFWFGFGIRGSVGGSPLDWGLAADFGAVYTFYPHTVPYVRLGLSLLNFGKWYAPVQGAEPFPAPFSLAFGVDAKLVARDMFDFSLVAGIEFPTFLNVLADIGFSARIAKIVEIYSSLQIDFRSYFDENRASTTLYPSFGISFTIPFKDLSLRKDPQSDLDRGGDIKIDLAASPRVRDIWQFGVATTLAFGLVDTVPPVVTIGITEQQKYVSPNNDGVKDALTFDISIQDDRYIKQYVVTIYNADNDVVRSIRNKERRIENQIVQEFFSRLFASEEGLELPPEIVWDGKMDNGRDAPDGSYYFTVYAEDDTGNSLHTEATPFEIDRKAPELTVQEYSAAERIFSPNGDGRLDTITFVQTGSKEAFWDIEIIKSDGSIVRNISIENHSLEDFVWDGTDNEGELLADGVYEYAVRGRDEAGNETSEVVSNIVLKTESTPLSLYLESAAFSPNGDGVKDTLTLVPLVGVTSGITEWNIEFYTEDLVSVNSFSGVTLPEPFVFSGTDRNGNILPEGNYFAKITLSYAHGNAPEVSSPPFILDVSVPQVKVNLSEEVISPNGDSIKDEIFISQEGSEEELWLAEISSLQQEVIFSKEFYQSVPPDFSWDGRTLEGRLAPDGQYIYKISSQDIAGNYGTSEVQLFSIDTSATDVILTAELRGFSPNGDGVQDEILFFPALGESKLSEVYVFVVARSNGVLVYEEKGEGPLPSQFSWNGKSASGTSISDGTYRANLEVTFPSGIISTASSAPFMLDTVAPNAEVSLESLLFSPDADGHKDTVLISQSSNEEEVWRGYVLDSNDKVVRNYLWEQGQTSSFLWDGKDDRGNVLPDASYRYLLRTTDESGNSFEYESTEIQIDTRAATLYLTLDSDALSPNGDGERDQLLFSLLTGREEGLETWELSIHDIDGSAIWKEQGSESFSTKEIIWNGQTQNGVIQEGIFTARFSARYDNGASPHIESTAFRVDNSPPILSLRIDPEFFSPDDDGLDDVLTFSILAEDLSGIAHWNLEIRDRSQELFQSFSGKGTPSSQIRWDGRSFDGELVISAEDYPYRLETVDLLGNMGVLEGIIPVDVLVIRDGDKLKVRVSAITFEPNSAELILDETDERGVKNLSVLQRLVEIFKKYRSYRIRIEGHAVNISGTDREDVEELIPLSEARAETVKTALSVRGIGSARIETMGRGGRDPIVAHTDLLQRWKNRRVEFILLK